MSSREPWIAALLRIERDEKDARAQELRGGHDAEFWRGRGGALHDVRIWLAESANSHPQPPTKGEQ